MWCLVSQPNGVVLEVEVDPKADGQECLDKVCKKLGIIEVDYFGLQYVVAKGEQLWLNMRNPIYKEVSGPPPYRFQLRVKFFVQPHLLLQGTTRHEFFMNLKQDYKDGKLKIPDRDQEAHMCGLIAQALHGDYDEEILRPHQYLEFLPEGCSPEFLTHVMTEHAQLSGLGQESAEYRMLQQVSTLESFGVEYFEVRDSQGQHLHMGVGPEGIALYNADFEFQKRIEYPTVQMATHDGKCLCLNIINDTGSTYTVDFKLVSRRAANSLYRCVTEKHSFYRCDTVRNAVTSQFCRDLKGTLASLFNENTSLGKKYVFDIRRTCREVHDYARRILYSSGSDVISQPTDVKSPKTKHRNDNAKSVQENDNSNSNDYQCLQEKLNRITDAMMCRICMDNNIDSVFCPCGHIACCIECSTKVNVCPLCRSDIEHTQKIFLPEFSVTPT